MPRARSPAKATADKAARNPARASATARALGRSLADFGRLRPAERKLRDCSRTGLLCQIGDELPEAETSTNSVRAEFVRFLALGGDERAPVHEHGVQLRGAWLTGSLDLEEARAVCGLLLHNCVIQEIQAIQAELKSLNLGGCQLGALAGDLMRCHGTVFLRNGFRATGPVRFSRAIIHGDLTCTGGRFEYRRDKVYSLNCDSATVHGHILLNKDFVAQGGVNLIGAQVTGDIDCKGGSFENPGNVAILFDRATVSGRLLFRQVEKVDGALVLTLMQVGSLVDDAASWRWASANVDLDGFTYGRLAGGAPVDAANRIAWLEGQYADFIGSDFRPQPWEQLIAVLRSMGHPNEAREVAVAKQRNLGRARKVVFGARTLHRLYGFFVGYGYKPIRLLLASATVWLLCFLAYLCASNPGWFGATTHLLGPPAREPSAACLAARAAARQGDPCPTSNPDHENFVPLVYSADVLLPVVDLGYQNEWQPVVSDSSGRPLLWGQLLRFLYWSEIFLGWIFGGALVAMLGNLIKKD